MWRIRVKAMAERERDWSQGPILVCLRDVRTCLCAYEQNDIRQEFWVWFNFLYRSTSTIKE